MPDWPHTISMPSWNPVITVYSSIVGVTAYGRAGTISSTAWSAANRAIYMPVLIPDVMVVAQLMHFNGATATGNVDVGLYDINYTRLVSSGAVAQSGTSAWQIFNVTDTQVPMGIYYLGVSLSSTSGTAMQSSMNGRVGSLMGVLMEESAHPLPSVMTPISMGALASIPFVGLTDRTVI